MKSNARFALTTIAAMVAMTLLAAGAGAAEPARLGVDGLRRSMLAHEDGLVVVDVRAPGDFAAGHIQAARNVPAAAIETAGLDKSGRIVVYCGEDPCHLTSGAAAQLMSDGYANVSILAGGLPAWIAKGYPVEGGAGTTAAAARKVARAEEAKGKLDGGTALALDVRPATEFAAGHLPGARSVPLETLDAALAGLPRDRELVVYDRQAARSRQAADKLTAAGLKAAELSGGLAGWIKKGLPLEVK